MFQVGDLIIYGGEGVCRVEAVGPSPVRGSNPGRLYYTLAPDVPQRADLRAHRCARAHAAHSDRGGGVGTHPENPGDELQF